MNATLFEIWGEPVPAYFTALLTGFALATWIGSRWAKRSGLDHEVVIDLGLYSLIAGVIGARLLHVFVDGHFWDYVHLCTDPTAVTWEVTGAAECAQLEGVWEPDDRRCHPAERDCFAWAAFWAGGLTYYGGLIAATAYGLWFLRREKFPLLKAADMAGMVIPLGLFFGRIGCFLGGCCFGTTVHEGMPLAVRFPAWSPASRAHWEADLLSGPHLPSLPVHPTQLYEALGCLAIAAVALLWTHPRKRFDGSVFLFFLGAYAALRFVLEYFRDDDRGGIGPLSTSQLIGVLVLGAVALVGHRLRRRASAKTA